MCVSARSALYITQRQEERRRAGTCGERVPGFGLPDSAGARTQAADRRPSPGETGPEGSRRTARPPMRPMTPEPERPRDLPCPFSLCIHTLNLYPTI